MAVSITANTNVVHLYPNTPNSAATITFGYVSNSAYDVIPQYQQYDTVTPRNGLEIAWGGGLGTYIGRDYNYVGSKQVKLEISLNTAENNHETFLRGYSGSCLLCAWVDGGEITDSSTRCQITVHIHPIQTTAITMYDYLSISAFTTNSAIVSWTPNICNWKSVTNDSVKDKQCRYIFYKKIEDGTVVPFYNGPYCSAETRNYTFSLEGQDKEFTLGVAVSGDGVYYSSSPNIAYCKVISALYDGSPQTTNEHPLSGITVSTTSTLKAKENATYNVVIDVDGDNQYYYSDALTNRVTGVTTSVYRATSAVTNSLTFGFNESGPKQILFKCWGGTPMLYSEAEIESMIINNIVANGSQPNYYFNVEFEDMYTDSYNVAQNIVYGYNIGSKYYTASTQVTRQAPIISAATYSPSSLTYAANTTNGQTINISNSNIISISTLVPPNFTATTSTTNGATITVGPSSQNTGSSERTGTLRFSACTTTHMYTGTTSLVQSAASNGITLNFTLVWEDGRDEIGANLNTKQIDAYEYDMMYLPSVIINKDSSWPNNLASKLEVIFTLYPYENGDSLEDVVGCGTPYSFTEIENKTKIKAVPNNDEFNIENGMILRVTFTSDDYQIANSETDFTITNVGS